MRRLYVDEQLSLKEIARLYDTAATNVSRWLKRAGVSSRSISEGTVLSGKFGVQSEAHRERLREGAAKARTKITAESREKWRLKMIGREPPNKGRPMSEEQRQLLTEQRADPEYRRHMSEANSGERAWNWKGGIKPELARRLDTAEWRRTRVEVYERDNWTCQECGCRCLNTKDAKAHPKRKIQAHHVVPRRFGGSDELSNLVTLCMSCHHKREGGLVAPS